MIILSYEYTDLIEELTSDIEERIIDKEQSIYIVRSKEKAYKNYYPVVDYYYDIDYLEDEDCLNLEEISVENLLIELKYHNSVIK